MSQHRIERSQAPEPLRRRRGQVVSAALLAVALCTPALALCAPGLARAQAPALRFVELGEPDRVLPLAKLRERCGTREVIVDDPYYHREMRFLAVPVACSLEHGFQRDAAELAQNSFLLRALDGYTKPASGEVLVESGGYLAFADATLTDVEADPIEPRFDPIDRRQVDPAPFYMVWTGVPPDEAHEKPWPYQLATIEIASLERAFARAAPSGVPRDDAAWQGFERFVGECIACHAINGEGGRVGPELNVPQSIVEYRDPEQLKQFIQSPQSFRYTSMPAHTHLSDADLDELIAYFVAMSERKDDPATRDGGDHE